MKRKNKKKIIEYKMETKEEMELFHKMLDRKVVFMGSWKKTEEIHNKFIKFLELRIEEIKYSMELTRKFIEK